MRIELPPGLEENPEARDIEVAMALVEEILHRETVSEDERLQEMARHVLFAGGKRLRPRISLIVYRACGGEELDHILEAAAAGELIHTASLVHDDIMDRAILRRGRWTIHAKYGVPDAIVAGDFLFTRGFYLAGRMDPTVVGMAAESSTRLAEGQVLEGESKDEEDLPLETYLTIIRKKTAEPFRTAAAIGAHLAGADDELVERMGDYGLALGMAFQIRDDLLDLEGDLGEIGKPTGTDVSGGVETLPFILHRQEGGGLPRWRSLDAVRSALQQTGALERAQAMGMEFADEARDHLSGLAPSPYEHMLRRLAEVAAARTY